MNLARVSSNGQVTVPIEIRRLLKLREGDKLLFSQKENGEVVVSNSSVFALQESQKAVEGSSFSESEILEEVMRVRYGEKL